MVFTGTHSRRKTFLRSISSGDNFWLLTTETGWPEAACAAASAAFASLAARLAACFSSWAGVSWIDMFLNLRNVYRVVCGTIEGVGRLGCKG